MTSYVALFRGETIKDAKMIAVTGSARVVSYVVAELLDEPEKEPETRDPVLKALAGGRDHALRLISDEAH